MSATEEPTAEDVFPLLVADVYELAGSLRRRGDDLAGRLGQTQARWQVMSVVSEGDWTVPDAARRLGVSRQAVQRIADLLVEDGLASFEDNPAHRRSPHLRLSEPGRRTLTQIAEANREQSAQILSKVSVEELEATRAVLRRLLDRLDEAEPDA